MTSSVKIHLLFLGLLLVFLVSCGGEINPSPTIIYAARDGKELKMDVFYGEDSFNVDSCDSDIALRPAILYFHGGSWISGTREKIHQRYREHVLRRLTERGIVVMSVDYRLVGLGRGHLEEAVNDCRDALAFVIENAEKLGVDTARIGLWGSSAGAHLAMMTVFADSTAARRVKFLIDDFGPVDIHEMFEVVPQWGREFVSDMIFDMEGKDLAKFDSLTTVYSPINYDTNLPVLIFHGEDDDVVNISQSRMLHEKLGEKSHFITFSGNGHGLKKLDSLQLREYIDNFENFLDTIL